MILVVAAGVLGLWLAGNRVPVGWGLAAAAHLLWLPTRSPVDRPASSWPWPPSAWSASTTTALVDHIAGPTLIGSGAGFRISESLAEAAGMSLTRQ
jgi:hypothetical protein